LSERIDWPSLPSTVKAFVTETLGSEVVGWSSQASGFSPGSADRVVTATSQQAFVKAVEPGLNADSVDLLRREGHMNRLLPQAAPCPRILGMLDTETWVALIFEDSDGRHPSAPLDMTEPGFG